MRSGTDGGGIREAIECRFQSKINVTRNSGSLTYYVGSFGQVTVSLRFLLCKMVTIFIPNS